MQESLTSPFPLMVDPWHGPQRELETLLLSCPCYPLHNKFASDAGIVCYCLYQVVGKNIKIYCSFSTNVEVNHFEVEIDNLTPTTAFGSISGPC